TTQTREFLIRGLIRKDTEKKLVKLLKSPAEARVLLKVLLAAYGNFFYEEVWKPRCAVVVNWERSVGITKKAKLDLIKRRQNELLIARKASKTRPILAAEKTLKQGELQVREPEVTSALGDEVMDL
ncbi:3815_t:CDS:1, partial [Gigaspora rosea]